MGIWRDEKDVNNKIKQVETNIKRQNKESKFLISLLKRISKQVNESINKQTYL